MKILGTCSLINALHLEVGSYSGSFLNGKPGQPIQTYTTESCCTCRLKEKQVVKEIMNPKRICELLAMVNCLGKN